MAKWRKLSTTGKHYPRRNGLPAVVRPGDVIECEAEELGTQLCHYERVDVPAPVRLTPEALEIKARGGGWFDVIDRETGAILNDKTLRRPEAEAFVRDRTGGAGGDPEPAADAPAGTEDDESEEDDE